MWSCLIDYFHCVFTSLVKVSASVKFDYYPWWLSQLAFKSSPGKARTRTAGFD
jgi:hypothetical protein